METTPKKKRTAHISLRVEPEFAEMLRQDAETQCRSMSAQLVYFYAIGRKLQQAEQKEKRRE